MADRFYVGEGLEIFLLHGIRVAYVSRPDQQDPKRFGKLVARNQYVNVESFSDINAAEGWLLK
jgi:hypothetical protein